MDSVRPYVRTARVDTTVDVPKASQNTSHTVLVSWTCLLHDCVESLTCVASGPEHCIIHMVFFASLTNTVQTTGMNDGFCLSI